MTDLISALADSVIALINAKPASPTKAEIEEVLAHYLFVVDAGTALYKLPGRKCEAPDPSELNEASLLRALVAINGFTEERQLKLDCQGEAPTLKSSEPCVVHADGQHQYKRSSSRLYQSWHCRCGACVL